MDDIIAGIYGLPGSGKTTLMCAVATASLRGVPFLGIPPKKYVFSNVPIPGTYELTLDMIAHADTSNSLLLIDEACQWFDSRSWKSFPKEYSTFFQTIRHDHTSICMFYQCFNDVDIRFRSICQQHFLIDALPFGFTLVRPIIHKQGLYNARPDDRYEFASLPSWRLIYRPRYYSLFDSYLQYRPPSDRVLVPYPGENPLAKNRLLLYPAKDTSRSL